MPQPGWKDGRIIISVDPGHRIEFRDNGSGLTVMPFLPVSFQPNSINSDLAFELEHERLIAIIKERGIFPVKKYLSSIASDSNFNLDPTQCLIKTALGGTIVQLNQDCSS